MFLWSMTPAEYERIRKEGGGQGCGARRSISGPEATWAFREAKGGKGASNHRKETVGEVTWVALLVGSCLSS